MQHNWNYFYFFKFYFILKDFQSNLKPVNVCSRSVVFTGFCSMTLTCRNWVKGWVRQRVPHCVPTQLEGWRERFFSSLMCLIQNLFPNESSCNNSPEGMCSLCALALKNIWLIDHTSCAGILVLKAAICANSILGFPFCSRHQWSRTANQNQATNLTSGFILSPGTFSSLHHLQLLLLPWHVMRKWLGTAQSHGERVMWNAKAETRAISHLPWGSSVPEE